MDRFGLVKLLQKAEQNKFDFENAVFAAVVKEVDVVDALQEKTESAARKMGTAMKRGDAPDTADYTKNRTKLIDKSKALQATLKRFNAMLKNKEKLYKKTDPKAVKLLADIDKQIDLVEDMLADHKNLPQANEMILGMLGGGYSVSKREDKAKDTPVKRPATANADEPGSGLMAEIEWFQQKVPSLVLKSMTKHEKAIKNLDLVTEWQNKRKKDFARLHQFLVKPTTDPETGLEDVAEDLTKYVVDARKAVQVLPEVTRAVAKLLHSTPRETSAVESLRKSVGKVEDVVGKAVNGLNAIKCVSRGLPNQYFQAALNRARKEAAAKAKNEVDA